MLGVANMWRKFWGMNLLLTPSEQQFQQQLFEYGKKQGGLNVEQTLVPYNIHAQEPQGAEVPSDAALSNSSEQGKKTGRMIIAGDVGSGKNYLLKRVLRSWALGEGALGQALRQSFDFILPMDLSLLTTSLKGCYDVWEGPIVAGTICPDNRENQDKNSNTRSRNSLEDIIADILTTRQDRTLLLAYGYDRALGAERRGYILELISRYPYFICAWRPVLVNPSISAQRFELVGFNQGQAESFVRSYFSNNTELAAKFITLLRSNASLKELARLPMQLQSICEQFAGLLQANTKVNIKQIFEHVFNVLAEHYMGYPTPTAEKKVVVEEVEALMEIVAQELIGIPYITLIVDVCRQRLGALGYEERAIADRIASTRHFGLVRRVYYDGQLDSYHYSYKFIDNCWKDYFTYRHLLKAGEQIPEELQYFTAAIDLNAVEPSHDVIAYVNQLSTTPVAQPQQEPAPASTASCYYKCQYPRDPMIGMLVGGAAGCILVLSMGIPATSTMSACVILSLAAAGAAAPPAFSHYISSSRDHSHPL